MIRYRLATLPPTRLRWLSSTSTFDSRGSSELKLSNRTISADWGSGVRDLEDTYASGFVITAALTFVISYIYCIATYGFLFGVGLGWLPSVIVAVVAGALWPLLALLLLIVVVGFVVLLALALLMD